MNFVAREKNGNSPLSPFPARQQKSKGKAQGGQISAAGNSDVRFSLSDFREHRDARRAQSGDPVAGQLPAQLSGYCRLGPRAAAMTAHSSRKQRGAALATRSRRSAGPRLSLAAPRTRRMDGEKAGCVAAEAFPYWTGGPAQGESLFGNQFELNKLCRLLYAFFQSCLNGSRGLP